MWQTKTNDLFFIFLVVFLSVLGLINFFSASYYYSLTNFSNPYSYFLDKFFLKITLAGFFVFIVGSLLGRNLVKLKKFFLFSFLGIYFLLILAFIPQLRLEETTARWLKFGSFSFQPSEIIKPFAILFLVFILAEMKRSSVLQKILVFILFAIFLLLPIFLQPSLSNVLIILFSLVSAYFVFMTSKREFFLSILVFVLFLILIILVGSFWSYRKERLISFLTKGNVFSEKYFQVEQATIAVSSGGIKGKGVGKSDIKILGLPQMFTDSIFAIYAEEWGFLGSLLFIILFLLLILKILSLGLATHQLEKIAFSLGVSTWLFLQTFIHLGSNIGLLVPTGVIMPFFSSGASGQLAIYFSLGIINGFKNG